MYRDYCNINFPPGKIFQIKINHPQFQPNQGKFVFLSGILRDKTMDDKLIHYDKQNYPFYGLKLLVKTILSQTINKLPKLRLRIIRKRVIKLTLGTSIIYSLMSTPSLFK